MATTSALRVRLTSTLFRPRHALPGLAGLVGCLLLLSGWNDGLEIQDRTAAEWARRLSLNPAQHFQAIPTIGPRIIPALVKELEECVDPLNFDYAYRTRVFLGERVPGFAEIPLGPLVSLAERRAHLLAVFYELGPAAAPVVPTLVPLLDDEELAVLAARTLGRIGPAARPAVPKLLARLADPEPFLVTALAAIAPEQPAVLAALRAAAVRGPHWLQLEASRELERLSVRVPPGPDLAGTQTAGGSQLQELPGWR